HILRSGNGFHGLCEREGDLAGRDDRLVRDPHEELVIERVDDRKLEASLRALTYAMGKKWMVLAKRRSDDEHPLELAHVCDAHPEPRHTGELAVRAEVALPQTEIDIARTPPPYELLEQVELLQRLMG